MSKEDDVRLTHPACMIAHMSNQHPYVEAGVYAFDVLRTTVDPSAAYEPLRTDEVAIIDDTGAEYRIRREGDRIVIYLPSRGPLSRLSVTPQAANVIEVAAAD